MKYRLKDGDKFSIPATRVQGYQLDTAKVPGNTVGTFDSASPATFNFYYNKLSNTTTKVHYYNAKGWQWVNCYAYDDQGNEPLGAWANQGKRDASKMKDDPDESDSKWLVVDVPSSACYVMFHNTNANAQVPDQGEPGYEVAGEAWIKDNVTSFNCSIVTSHIDLETGEKLSPDVTKSFTNVRSNQTYTTTPDTSLGREYITPALASGFYQPGVLNVVYLYTGEVQPTPDKQKYGDIDGDGYVTIMDATVLQRALAKSVSLTDDQKTVADVDGDENITISDVTYIKRYLAEMKVKGNRTGQIVGETPVGEHTYDEFVNAYNALNTLLAKYPAEKYSTNAAYQQAQSALASTSTVAMDPSSDPEDIDAAYDTVAAAYAALSAVQIEDDDDDDDDNGGTIIFSNNKGFSTVNIYYWSDSDKPVEWPGVPMTYLDSNEYGEQRYSFEMPAGMTNYIINDGTQQTVDIPFTGSTGVYMTDLDDEGHYMVDFYEIEGGTGGGGGEEHHEDQAYFLLTDNFGWGTAYVYAWNDNGDELNGEWPGASQAETVTNDYGETQFKCYVPEGAKGVILSNGNGAQTEDITDFSHAGYWMDGTQNDQGHYIVTAWD